MFAVSFTSSENAFLLADIKLIETSLHSEWLSCESVACYLYLLPYLKLKTPIKPKILLFLFIGSVYKKEEVLTYKCYKWSLSEKNNNNNNNKN